MPLDPVTGQGGIAFLAIYLLSLLLIGFFANRSRQEKSLRDYYLAGSSLGPVALFFTLYATQYSGNTLFAVPGKAYRNGLIGLSVVVAVMGIVLIYSLFATRLNRYAHRHELVSIGDFIRHRFASRPLLILVNVIAMITLITYALGNFKAVGLLLENASNGTLSFASGIMLLAVVMGIYESLGGLRGVVWTDILQGSLLFSGSLLIFFCVVSLDDATSITRPAVFGRELVRFFSEEARLVSFVSTVLLIAFGAAVYPQAIQRMYMARNPRVLLRSYIPLFFMPLLTTLPMILVGISVAAWAPDLDTRQSENVIIYAIGHITRHYPGLSWLLVLYMGAAIAAIMSTIDSALLTLGSLVVNDVIGQGQETGDPQKQIRLYRAGRYTSWILMLIMAVLAIILPHTIWSLMIFKFELLIQIVPVFILGSMFPRLSKGPVLAGLIGGSLVAMLLKVSSLTTMDLSQPLGIHAGIWGLLFNLVLVLAGTGRLSRQSAPQS